MKSKINNFKLIISNNKTVIENYFFMTVLQIINSFFYLLIYPYLIKKAKYTAPIIHPPITSVA